MTSDATASVRERVAQAIRLADYRARKQPDPTGPESLRDEFYGRLADTALDSLTPADLQSLAERMGMSFEQGWQTMDSAPKGFAGTGPRLLLWDGFHVFEGFRNGMSGYVMAQTLQPRPWTKAWRSLPSPPAQQDEQR